MLGWLEVLYQSTSLEVDSDDKSNLTNPIASNKERLAHNLYNVYAHRYVLVPRKENKCISVLHLKGKFRNSFFVPES